MNGRMNGELHGSTAMRQAASKFGELDFRRVIAQVEEFMRQAQGQAPVGDPVAILAIGLLLDRFIDVTARLDRIEKAVAAMAVPARAVGIRLDERS